MGASREFAAELSRIMEDRKLTNSDLARILDITPSSVSQWRASEGTLPTRRRVGELEAFFGVEPGTFERIVQRDRDADPSQRRASVSVRKTVTVEPAKPRPEPRGRAGYRLGTTTLGEPMNATVDDEVDPEQLTFALSSGMVESLARMKMLTEQVDSLNDQAGALFAQANEIGFDDPTRRDDVQQLLDEASAKLSRGKELLRQVHALRQLAEKQRQQAEWVIRTTRHVVDEDKKPDAEVMAAKVQHVVKTHQQRQRGRRRQQLKQRFLRVDRELRSWFTNDHQPDVRPLLALLTLLVARVNTLEDEVQALKKASSAGD